MVNVIDTMNVNLGRVWEKMEDRGAWRAMIHGVCKESDMTQTEQKHSVKFIGVQAAMAGQTLPSCGHVRIPD